ncbi:MAG: hypothetical protein LBL66_03925 [Clostridiales bacterium]|jgi:cell division protein FtsL|nr:hypothetical protein [Clostridiales bacterium]
MQQQTNTKKMSWVILGLAALIAIAGIVFLGIKAYDANRKAADLSENINTLNEKLNQLDSARDAQNATAGGLQSQITELQSQITELLSEVTALTNQLNSTGGVASGLQSQIAALNEEIAALVQKMEEMSTKLRAQSMEVTTPFVFGVSLDSFGFTAGAVTVTYTSGETAELPYNSPLLNVDFDWTTGDASVRYGVQTVEIEDVAVSGGAFAAPANATELRDALNDHSGLRAIWLDKNTAYDMKGLINTQNSDGTQQDVVIGNGATLTLGAPAPSGPSGWANFRGDTVLYDVIFNVTETGASNNAALRFYNPATGNLGRKIEVYMNKVAVTSTNPNEGFAYAVNASDNVHAVIEDCNFAGSTKNTVLASIHSAVEIKNSTIGTGTWGAVSIAHGGAADYQSDDTAVTIDAATVAKLAGGAAVYLDNDDTNHNNTITLRGVGIGGADVVLNKTNAVWSKS